eukprot:SAG11_NODE_4233_length_1997_cov_1.303477_2_plen_172_part_00
MRCRVAAFWFDFLFLSRGMHRMLPPRARHLSCNTTGAGFVIKRGYLCPQACARAREWLWSNSESAAPSVGRSGKPMDRHNPDSWLGPFIPDSAVAERQKSLWGGASEMEYLRGNRWIVHQFGSTEEFIDCLPRRMAPIAEQLLGRPVVQPVVGAPTNAANWGWERGGGVHG